MAYKKKCCSHLNPWNDKFPKSRFVFEFLTEETFFFFTFKTVISWSVIDLLDDIKSTLGIEPLHIKNVFTTSQRILVDVEGGVLKK